MHSKIKDNEQMNDGFSPLNTYKREFKQSSLNGSESKQVKMKRISTLKKGQFGCSFYK